MSQHLYSVTEAQWRKLRKQPLVPGSVYHCQELGENWIVTADGTPVKLGDVLVLKMPASAQGAPGNDSTVPGPQGERGLQGERGEKGDCGPKGDITVVGDAELREAVQVLRRKLAARQAAVLHQFELNRGRSHSGMRAAINETLRAIERDSQ